MRRRFSTLFERVRRPVTVTASVAVIAAGFMPVEAYVTAQPTTHRVVATPVPVGKFTPAEMEIPKIGVKAPVVPVGTEADGKMASPSGAVDVGWWNGRKPGDGNALFAAHVNWNGALGTFFRLKELKEGDEVVVRGEGKTLTYRVLWVKNYDGGIDATDLLGNASGEQIATLITCGGQFDRSIGHHLERVVARAVLST
jgi:LPXTG-site transpeptidase (sortase) family protein